MRARQAAADDGGHIPRIDPVPEGVERPLWSVMIPTYHCARHLRHTLESVLAQDPGPSQMQIEVVDDHSTRDDPEAVVEEVGRGRVGFHRQPENVGHVRNFNTCLRRSRGHIVHILHGDDAVRPGFYEKLGAALANAPEAGAAFCRHLVMNEEGHWQVVGWMLRRTPGILDNWLETIATGQRLQTPSMVVRRRVYEELGGFDDRIERYGEDWEMWVRIAAHYPVWYEPEPLAIYRVGASSLSGQTVRTGANMRDLARVVELNERHLPLDSVERISRQARRNISQAALRRAYRLIRAGEIEAARSQIREAIRMTPVPVIVAGGAILLAVCAAGDLGLPVARRAPESGSRRAPADGANPNAVANPGGGR